ncbi:MAG TPA: thiamine pyrophosphate-dependent enzyme [Roseiarcus sp.]|jgi:pyruvate dehydrogenase (quinone)/pyruvate oxidase|nr:thiamine pyrophosphate-dependent enzyme [Roseiarcus sp.]
MPETVSDHVVQILQDWGVDTVFGLPGDGINGLVEAFRKTKDSIRYVHCRHEESAALAACAYAKFTGRLGVCFATAAPGAVHLLNGLYDAKIDGASVLAITGMTYHDLIGTHYLQDINQDYLYQDVAIYNQRLMGPAHVENVLNFACRAAVANSGVAHVAIPIDIQAMPASQEKRFKRNVRGHTSASYQPSRPTPDPALVEEAAQLLQDCKKLAILAGAGARNAGSELELVAERRAAPIVKALLGKDCVADDSPCCVGGLGVVGTRAALHAMKQCDCLLIVGSCFPYIEFLPSPGQAKCVQIDNKPEHIGLRYPADIGLVGDAQATLRALLSRLPRNDDRSFLQQAQYDMVAWRALMEERAGSDRTPMRPQVVTKHLSELLDENAIICGDSGTVTTWQARMELRAGQRFSFSGTMCSMMAALPYSIGASAAFPNRQVVAFTGDGSFTMMMGEFATLVQHRLPVKVVVMKNNTLGLIKWEQMLYLGNPEYGVDLHPVDFAKIAEACGAPGIRIDDPKRCRDQLKEALSRPGPGLIECVVDPLEPPWPPMITTDEQKKLMTALARGEVNRSPVGLSIGRHAVQEFSFSASPFGAAARIVERITGRGDES